MQQTKTATHVSIVGADEWRDNGVPEKEHYIGLATIGFNMKLSDADRALVNKAFTTKKVTQRGDSFYSYDLHYGAHSQRVYVVCNGEMGFTAMLPEEY